MKKLLCLLLMVFTPLAWAANKKVTIDIKDMTCSLCVVSINQALRSTQGVIKAKASLKTRQAEVIVPEAFDDSQLLAAIARTGYSGAIHEVTPAG